MAEKTLAMIFLNQDGARTTVSLPGVRDNATEAEVSAAMDVVIAKNVFYSAGGDFVAKHSAQITERNVTELNVK